MTTRNFRWLRVALVLVAVAMIAAMSTGAYALLYVERELPGDGFDRVKTGMSKLQVRLLNGAPHSNLTKGSDSWGYRLRGLNLYMRLTFKDGIVLEKAAAPKTVDMIP